MNCIIFWGSQLLIIVMGYSYVKGSTHYIFLPALKWLIVNHVLYQQTRVTSFFLMVLQLRMLLIIMVSSMLYSTSLSLGQILPILSKKSVSSGMIPGSLTLPS
jgi:hypothetical protein